MAKQPRKRLLRKLPERCKKRLVIFNRRLMQLIISERKRRARDKVFGSLIEKGKHELHKSDPDIKLLKKIELFGKEKLVDDKRYLVQLEVAGRLARKLLELKGNYGNEEIDSALADVLGGSLQHKTHVDSMATLMLALQAKFPKSKEEIKTRLSSIQNKKEQVKKAIETDKGFLDDLELWKQETGQEWKFT